MATVRTAVDIESVRRRDSSQKMSSFKITLSAVEAFERGIGALGVKTDRRRTGITLQDLILIEDDGPGIGSNCEYLKTGRSPVFEIAGDNLLLAPQHR